MVAHELPLTIGEILTQIKGAKNKAERIALLKKHESWPLKHFLRLAFDPNIKLDLPEGRLPFTPNPKPVGFGDTTLKTVFGPKSGFYIFIAKNAPGLRQAKRELNFILLLEQLDSQEAEFLLAAKDKKLDVGLTRKVIDEVFPDLLSSEVKSKSEEKDETQTDAAPQSNS